MEKVEEGVLRGMIGWRGSKRPAKADGALPKARAAKKARR